MDAICWVIRTPCVRAFSSILASGLWTRSNVLHWLRFSALMDGSSDARLAQLGQFGIRVPGIAASSSSGQELGRRPPKGSPRPPGKSIIRDTPFDLW